MKRVHYTDSYLLVPQHPVTVNLIGGGGTGSQVLTNRQRLPTTNYLSTGRRNSGSRSSHTSEVTEIPQRVTLFS